MEKQSVFDKNKSDTESMLTALLEGARDALAAQGMLLSTQINFYNNRLSRYGLVIQPDGMVYEYADDFAPAKKEPTPINLKQPVKLSDATIESATAFNMALYNMSMNKVLKASLVGTDLIRSSLGQTMASIPTKSMSKARQDRLATTLASSAFRFMVGTAEITNLYKFGSPSPTTFKALNPDAYTVADSIARDLVQDNVM